MTHDMLFYLAFMTVPPAILTNYSSFAPPDYSSKLYNYIWIDNFYAKISTRIILVKP